VAHPSFREFLRAFPAARSLGRSELHRLIEHTVEVSFEPQAVVFAAGDDPDAAYLIRRGSVLVLHSGRMDSVALARLYRGDMVGEMGLVDGRPRSASAVAEDGLSCWRLSRDSYASLRDDGDPVAEWLLGELGRGLCERIRGVEARIGRAALQPAGVRVPPRRRQRDPRTLLDWFRRL